MILEIPNLEGFVGELNALKIKEAYMYAYYKTEPAGAVSFTTFFIKLTSKFKDLTGEQILLLEEPVGRGITQDKEEMARLGGAMKARVDQIKAILKKEKVKIKEGVWR